MFQRLEGDVESRLKSLYSIPRRTLDSSFAITGRRSRNSWVWLSVFEPGPHFLAMLDLEEPLLATEERKELIQWRYSGVVDGTIYSFDRFASCKLNSFLTSFNCIWVRFEKRQGQRFKYKPARQAPNSRHFPRELLWYFGIERLQVDGVKTEREDDAWKKLPMLLWE